MTDAAMKRNQARHCLPLAPDEVIVPTDLLEDALKIARRHEGESEACAIMASDLRLLVSVLRHLDGKRVRLVTLQ